MSRRIYNFSPGPAALPKKVIEQAKNEMLNWRQSEVSVMEVSHRSVLFGDLVAQLEQDLRDVLSIPTNYRVLFMHGGAQSQFSMVPMNLLLPDSVAAYAQTGLWSNIAKNTADQFCVTHSAINLHGDNCNGIPMIDAWDIPSNSSYLYYVDNESVDGLEFNFIPDCGDIPLVCDMTSNMLTREFPVDRFGLVFASAQKNMGISGVTIVIIRDDLLQRQFMAMTPPLYQYRLIADKSSLANTPSTFSWYMAGLMLQWVKGEGGLSAIESLADQKSDLLYKCIDDSDLYINTVNKQFRSRINIVFQLVDSSLENEFLRQAKSQGLVNLKGHRSVGGMRASVYNGMSLSGVRALVDFMYEFAESHVV